MLTISQPHLSAPNGAIEEVGRHARSHSWHTQLALANKNEAQRRLYPEIESCRHGRLKVSEIHEIYFEECGNPNGKPVVFLHGGPGTGATPTDRRYFDPQTYRIILFDQRGCGRSRPLGCLEMNTTWHIVEDMERLPLVDA